jgi:hypothetical protein
VDRGESKNTLKLNGPSHLSLQRKNEVTNQCHNNILHNKYNHFIKTAKFFQAFIAGVFGLNHIFMGAKCCVLYLLNGIMPSFAFFGGFLVFLGSQLFCNGWLCHIDLTNTCGCALSFFTKYYTIVTSAKCLSKL